MKVLILGATGAVGTALEARFRLHDIPTVGVGHQECEVTRPGEIQKILDREQPTVVVNCVAKVGIQPCEVDSDLAYQVNTTPVLHLAKLCEAHSLTLVQTSTHAVFDGRLEGGYSESHIPRPINVYAGSKYLSEQYALNLCRQSYVFRFPTLYGPRRNQSLGFVDKVLNWLKTKDRIQIAEDKIDSPTYTQDVAEAIYGVLKDKREFGVYHIANHGHVSYFDFVKKIATYLGSTCRVEGVKDAHFPSDGQKPLKTAMFSEKLPRLRDWDVALQDYLQTIGETGEVSK